RRERLDRRHDRRVDEVAPEVLRPRRDVVLPLRLGRQPVDRDREHLRLGLQRAGQGEGERQQHERRESDQERIQQPVANRAPNPWSSALTPGEGQGGGAAHGSYLNSRSCTSDSTTSTTNIAIDTAAARPISNTWKARR